MRRAPTAITLHALRRDGTRNEAFQGIIALEGFYRRDPENPTVRIPIAQAKFAEGEAVLEKAMVTRVPPAAQGERLEALILPGWVSLLPPILAIALAIAFRQVIMALAFVADKYVLNTVAHDPGHVHVIFFTLMIGGMVAVVSRSGGTQGIVDAVSRHVRSVRTGQVSTWVLGLLIFFDDYANTLIVGNTMRPFTDRLRISREKLSYIVDSTAAPVACVAIISLWIGMELSLIGDYKESIDGALASVGIRAPDVYGIFIASIPYSFYCLLTLFFVFVVATTLRDFGPMRRAEERAHATGEVLRPGSVPLSDKELSMLEAPEGKPRRWVNAVVPIGGLILFTIVGLYVTGYKALGSEAKNVGLVEIFGAADSYKVLLWAAFGGGLLAVVLAVSQRILSLEEALRTWVTGIKSMVLAVIVLLLAWSLGALCKGEMLTGSYLVEICRDVLPPSLLPLLVFLLAAGISFATGTSWGTMAILFPVAIPMACVFIGEGGVSPERAAPILYATIAAILSGATFGDHCSPISDTTILSSMASSCDHIDHVRTQIPYALTVAGVAAFLGYLPVGFGIPVYVSLAVGVVVLTAVVYLVGRPVAS
jgi:Na+/H+ antiporter NhaC